MRCVLLRNIIFLPLGFILTFLKYFYIFDFASLSNLLSDKTLHSFQCFVVLPKVKKVSQLSLLQDRIPPNHRPSKRKISLLRSEHRPKRNVSSQSCLLLKINVFSLCVIYTFKYIYSNCLEVKTNSVLFSLACKAIKIILYFKQENVHVP